MVNIQSSPKEDLLDAVINEVDEAIKDPAYAELATDDSVYDVIATVSKNMVEIVNAATKTHVVTGIMLKGKIGTTVGHIAWKEELKKDISQYMVRDITGTYYSMEFKYFDQENDRLDFALVGCNKQFPDIIRHISKVESDFFRGKLAVMASMCFINNIPTLKLRFFRISTYKGIELNGYYSTNAWSYSGGLSGFSSELPPQTVKGDCGSIVFLCDASRNQKIIGMHIASSDQSGYFRNMTSSMYSNVVNAEAQRSFEGPLEEFAAPRFPTKNGYPVIARCEQPSFLPSKTHLYRSPFAYKKCIYAPSVLDKRDPRAPDIEDMIYKESIKWLGQPIVISEEKKNIIRERFSLLGDYFGQKLYAHGIGTTVLTKTGALNTVRGFTHSKPIPVATSAGYPFNQIVSSGKTQLVSVNTKDGIRKFTKDLQLVNAIHQSIDHILKNAKEGLPAEVAFQVFAKDELLKEEKLKTKTRTIAAAPFSLVVALRMYFHTIYAALAEIWDCIPVKVGISPNSLDWHMLTCRLLGVSSIGFSIDQTDFDFNVPRELNEGVVHCLNAIADWTDEECTPMDHQVRIGLHRNVSEFKIILNGLVYQSTKGVASGHPGTATENSLISLFCLFDAFCELAPTSISPTVEYFFELIEAAIYGDDVLCAVHETISSWFNIQTVARYLTETYGMKITTSDKSALNYTTKPISELDFISRSFKKMGAYWVGPLDMKRLLKPLHFCHGNKAHHYYLEPEAITDDLTVAYDAAHSALDEMFFHGEEEYESLRRHLIKRCHELCLTEAYFAPFSEKYREFFHINSGPLQGLYVHHFEVEASVIPKLCQIKGWFHYKSRRCLLLGNDYYWDQRSQGKSQPMPLFAANILRRVNDLCDTDFNQILINEYAPPNGCIDYHKDNEQGLDKDEGVASLTVCGDGLMQWADKEGTIVGKLECMPGTLYHMCGVFVTDYRHRRINHSKYTITMTFRRIDSSL